MKLTKQNRHDIVTVLADMMNYVIADELTDFKMFVTQPSDDRGPRSEHYIRGKTLTMVFEIANPST